MKIKLITLILTCNMSVCFAKPGGWISDFFKQNNNSHHHCEPVYIHKHYAPNIYYTSPSVYYIPQNTYMRPYNNVPVYVYPRVVPYRYNNTHCW